jgi:hypothetical protein
VAVKNMSMKNAWKSGLVVLPVLLAEKKHLHQNLHASAICQEGSGPNMCPEIINCFQVKRDSSHLKLGDTRSRLQRKQKKIKRAVIAASMKCAAQRSDKIKRTQMPLGQSSLHIHKENINPQLRSKCQDCVLGHFWEDRPWIQSSNVFNSGGLSVHDFSAQVPYSWLERSILRFFS